MFFIQTVDPVGQFLDAVGFGAGLGRKHVGRQRNVAPAAYDPGVSLGAVQQASNAMSRGFLKGTGSLVGVVDPRGMTAANQTIEQTFPADPTLLNRTLEAGGAMALPLAASAASGGTLMAPVMGAQGIGQGRMQAQELRNQGIGLF